MRIRRTGDQPETMSTIIKRQIINTGDFKCQSGTKKELFINV